MLYIYYRRRSQTAGNSQMLTKLICQECGDNYTKQPRQKLNLCQDCLKERLRERCRKYKRNNKEKISSYNSEYKAEHKQEISEYNKQYDREHRAEIQKRQTKQHAIRRKVDPKYKFTCNMRKRMHQLIKSGSKSASTLELLGCGPKDVKFWIEFQFKDGMTWENHGSVWHFDHVIPCALFDQEDPEEQAKCWHWTNYQPMFGSKNMSKGHRISKEDIEAHDNILNEFLKMYEDYDKDDIDYKFNSCEFDRYDYVNIKPIATKS